MRLNESCEREFKISSWPRWYYDLGRGSLTFLKDDAPRVVASIQVVGTTSKRSGTWLWSWANESLPTEVTKEMQKVRRFGETEGLFELTSSSVADNDHFGWEMAAVTAQILGSKGAYRCPSEKGFLYVVYRDLSFAVPEAVRRNAPQVECGIHEFGYQTFVCEHLFSEPAQFWFSNPPTEEDQWPDAWCAACEARFQEHGEWSEKNESKANIKLLCHRCYESLRLHSKVGNQ